MMMGMCMMKTYDDVLSKFGRESIIDHSMFGIE
jgi:hypothetical protein